MLSFSYSQHVHYAMIKTEKVFFHLVTMFTIPWSRVKKVFFFIQSLRSLRHYQEVTTFTTPWLREKKSFFHWVTTLITPWSREEKKTFFHFSTTFATPWSQQKDINFYCATTLTALRSWKNILFSFHYYFHYANMFLHLTTLLICRKSLQTISSPEKYV